MIRIAPLIAGNQRNCEHSGRACDIDWSKVDRALGKPGTSSPWSPKYACREPT